MSQIISHAIILPLKENFSIKEQWDKPIQNIETNFVESSIRTSTGSLRWF